MRERHITQRSFADLEFYFQGIHLDPLLARISDFLDRQPQLIALVEEDLVRGLKDRGRGRRGLTAEQVLRSFILQRIKSWSYRELRERIADGYTLRHFTRFDSQAVPCRADAFQRSFSRLRRETMDELNRAVVRGAVGLGLEDGSQLRVDTTVVETDIHYPTDSTLLWDGVRVICRLVEQLGGRAPEAAQDFSDHRRRARRRMQEISRMRDRRGKRRRSWRRKYRDLLRVSEEVVRSAAEVVERARSVKLADPLDILIVATLAEEIVRYCTLLARVMDQTRRRVFAEETVPSDEKVYSLFEPHTDLIKRGKARKPVELGHKVFFAESRIGLITDYQVLDGNPPDERQVEDSLKRHTGLFGHLPDLYAGDRGFDGAQTRQAETGGVTMCIPQRGGQRTPERTAEEKSRRFKSGQRFRAGIEGRISVLFRGRGMKRCRLHGRERFGIFVAAAVLANNLLVIAARLERKARRKDKTKLRLAA